MAGGDGAAGGGGGAAAAPSDAGNTRAGETRRIRRSRKRLIIPAPAPRRPARPSSGSIAGPAGRRGRAATRRLPVAAPDIAPPRAAPSVQSMQVRAAEVVREDLRVRLAGARHADRPHLAHPDPVAEPGAMEHERVAVAVDLEQR